MACCCFRYPETVDNSKSTKKVGAHDKHGDWSEESSGPWLDFSFDQSSWAPTLKNFLKTTRPGRVVFYYGVIGVEEAVASSPTGTDNFSTPIKQTSPQGR